MYNKYQETVEYQKLYSEVIREQLPRSFVKMYEKNNCLHDWYLKSFYVANTGPFLQTYSARGNSTLQIEFATSNNDKNILLIYKNLCKFDVAFDKSENDDVCAQSATGFGRCLSSRFHIGDNSKIYHELLFERGTISIGCDGIGYRRIINNYWT